MGYSATYKINEELDSKFKSNFKLIKQHDIEKSKISLIGVCLIAREITTYSLTKLYDEIYAFVRIHIMNLRDSWCNNLQEQLKESNEIQVCGWEFTRDKVFKDLEDYEEYLTENLFYITLTPTDFENSEKYYEKINIIKEYISDSDYIVGDIMDRDLFDTYSKKEGSEFEDSY